MIMVRSRVLASGQINGSDMISVELVQPTDAPAVVIVKWPQAPTVADPRRFSSVANAIMHIMASAAVRLTALRAKRL
jgi:hypothetical protein